tara:strand:+ start:897 stop:1343 length:447 start_codon:yes stop_codon:yes gene_type:complete
MGSILNDLKQFFGFAETEETNESPTIKSKKPFKGSLINSGTPRPFASSEIKVLEPRIYEDSLNIASYLRDNKPVIVNLKFLDSESSKRLIDFVCGTAYAINGHMMKLGENIFLFTPANILISNSEEQASYPEDNSFEKQVLFKKAASY